MKRIKIALSVVAAALVVSLIGNIYLGASYAAQQFETGYQAGYEAAQEEAQAKKVTPATGNNSRYTYTFVYVTKSGEKYHRETCRYAEDA